MASQIEVAVLGNVHCRSCQQNLQSMPHQWSTPAHASSMVDPSPCFINGRPQPMLHQWSTPALASIFTASTTWLLKGLLHAYLAQSIGD
jgi:hypothetical protein